MPIIYRPEPSPGSVHICDRPRPSESYAYNTGTVWECPECFSLHELYRSGIAIKWRRMGWIETQVFRWKLRKRGR